MNMYLSQYRARTLILAAEEAVGVKPQTLDAVVPHCDAGPLGREHPLLGEETHVTSVVGGGPKNRLSKGG